MKNTRTNFCILCIALIFSTACTRSIETSTKTADIAPKAGKPSTGGGGTVQAKAVCNFNLNEDSLRNAGWVKEFDDEFGSGLSAWNIWQSGSYNNELQFYQPGNLQFVNDTLKIVVKAEPATGPTDPYSTTPKTFNYTSARIESKALYSASTATPKVRMSARIKLPAGYGMWPAWWSYGDPWPVQGEIDILEARGQEPYNFQTNYFYGKTANRNLVKNATTVIVSNVNLQTCWHVYELVWERNSLSFYLDGALVDKKTGGYVSSLFGKQEKLVLNVAVGGVFFYNLNPALIQPGTMEVDWVKVFTSN
jgi:beta-glucanase (GH16 family)